MGKALATILRLMSFKNFKGRIGKEDALAIDVAMMLRVESIRGSLKGTWTCIPHEVGAMSLGTKGFRLAQARYAKAKAMGLITGSADYVFVWPQGGGWIELKSKDGSLSKEQRDFRDWCDASGTHYAVCRSVDQVRETLISWGVLTDRG